MNVVLLIICLISSNVFAMEQYDDEQEIDLSLIEYHERKFRKNNFRLLRSLKKSYKRVQEMTQEVRSAQQWISEKVLHLLQIYGPSRLVWRMIAIQNNCRSLAVLENGDEWQLVVNDDE